MSMESTENPCCSSEERQLLLPPDFRHVKSRRIKFYISLAVAMMLYKGTEMMYANTINSYLFTRIYKQRKLDNASELTAYYNGSRVPNLCYPDVTIEEDEDVAMEHADKFQTVLTDVASTLSLVTLIIYGLLSDYLGRKYLLLVVVGGYTLQILVAMAVVVFTLDLSYLLVAYGIDGFGGSTFGFSLACFICVADMTSDKKERALGIALIESLNGLGRITTEFATQYFIACAGHVVPLVVSLLFCVGTILLVVFIIPETLPAFDRKGHSKCPVISLRRLLPTAKQLWKNLFGFYFNRREFPGKTLYFRLCFVIFLLVESPIIFRTELTTLIQVGPPNCWSSQKVASYRAVEIGLNYVVGLFLLKPFQYIMNDTVISLLGVISGMAYNIATGLASSVMAYYIGALSGTLMLIPKPVVRGVASKMAGPDRQGAVFAGLVAAELLCEVVSNAVFYMTYAHSHSVVKGTVFLYIAGVLLLACPLIFVLGRHPVFATVTEHVHRAQSVNINPSDEISSCRAEADEEDLTSSTSLSGVPANKL